MSRARFPRKNTRRLQAMALLILVTATLAPLASLPAPLAQEEVAAQGEVTYPPFVPDSAITNMKVVAFDDEPDSNPCGSGWSWIDTDLNKWAGGDWVYFCYQEGAPGNAVTDITFIQNTTSCPSGYSRDSTDLNQGAGGADIYLCFKKGGALPLIQLDVVTGITSLVACPYSGGASWTKEPTDLNDGAGGLFIYLCYIDLAGIAGIDNCGNEGEGPCIVFSTFFWENGSGTCDRGLRQAGDECVNGLGDHARYNWDIDEFRATWAYWALQNQRQQLAWDEPLTSVMHIGAHNAYNNTADGYILSNQTYSITDVLRAGVRQIELDVHSGERILTGTYPQLCHAGGAGAHVGCVVGDRDFYNAIKEIRYWMSRPENADEVVVLFIENSAASEDFGYIGGVLDLYLGGPDIGLYTRADWQADGGRSRPSQAELVARGQRAVVYASGDEIEPTLGKGDIVDSASFITGFLEDLDTETCAFRGIPVDRTFPRFLRVYDNRIAGFFGEPGVGGKVRRTTPAELASFARCNVSMITLDDILDYDDDETRGDRLKSAIWSWAEGVYGQPGDAAYISATDNRWHSDVPETERHYVCLNGSTWRVTEATGPFNGGSAACAQEFDGSTFSVPRNGYENTLLSDVLAGAGGNAWLNYQDTDADRWWASLLTGSITGPTVVAEGEAPAYTVHLETEATIVEATCGDGAADSLDLPDRAGETFASDSERFTCPFSDGPSTSTITWVFDDPNAEADLVLQLPITISNEPPRLISARRSTMLDEDSFISWLTFEMRDPGGYIGLDESGTEPLTATIDWGDGTSEPLILNQTYALTHDARATNDRTSSRTAKHAWDVPGLYEVSVTTCDDDDACSTSVQYDVTVLHAYASIDSMPADTILDEGDTFSGTATIDVPDNGDTYKLAVTYGDGSAPQEFIVTAADTTLNLSHTYADSGSFAVEIVICDNEGGCASSDTTTVTVNNVSPVLTPVEDFTVAEGETFTRVLASFTDPGFDCPSPTCDPPSIEDFTALIGWADATANPGEIAETPGGPGTATTGTLSGTHTYTDNGTYRTAFGIWDDDEIAAAFPETLTITVENAPPSVDTPVITPSPSNEGAAVLLTAPFSDPGGVGDGPFTCEISWGDGSTTEGVVDGITCTGNHTYADDGLTGVPSEHYDVFVTVTDKDGGNGIGGVVHTVNNIAPTLSNVNAPPTDLSNMTTLNGDISDPSMSDSFTLLVEWGDGSTPETFSYGPGTTSFSEAHQYPDVFGDYPGTATLCDDDGSCGSADFIVTVPDVDAPTITLIERTPANDAGWNNTAVTVIWSCADADSGVVAAEVSQALNSDGEGQSVTGTCEDNAGNTISHTVSGINIDQTAPLAAHGGPYSVAEGAVLALDGSGSTDTLSGLGAMTWDLDGDFETPNPALFNGLDGPAAPSIALKVSDLAGNESITQTTVDVTNMAPTITGIELDLTGPRATLTVTASDPAGTLDPLRYAFDCDNDDEYEVDAGDATSATCYFGFYEGAFQVNAQVSDDDGGVTAGSVTVTNATELCANDHSGVLRYSDDCRNHESAVTIPGDGPVTVCASTHNGMLRLPANGSCAKHQTTYVLPEDGPLNVCVSNYTQTMRVVDDIAQCTGHEFGRVIAATEVGELPTRRVR